ncbi:MAG: hypothetical protein ACPK85_05540 [Methanosarcina sp.]
MIERTEVHFNSNGVTCTGYLYHPVYTDSILPRMVLTDGFTGTQDTPSI